MPGTKPRVLHYDDDPEMLETVRSMLAFDGIEAVGAANAAAFRERLAEGGWALLLIDLLPAEGNGIDLARQLRRDEVRTPILVLVSKPLAEDERQTLDACAARLLTKPFGPRELLRRVWECLPPVA